MAARRPPIDPTARGPHHADAPPPPPRSCCASRRRCTRGRGRSGCSWRELALRTTRSTSWPGSAPTVVGYAGLMFIAATTATSPPSPSTRRGTGTRSATRLLLALARAARGGAHEPHARGARQQRRRRRRMYRRFGFAPAGIRKSYYAETNEDAIVMWAHDIDQPEYARALTAIEADDPGHHGRRRRGVAMRARRERTVDASTCILGIETSCDETAAAVVAGGTDVLSSVVSSQVDLHARFGGVVPEIASRAHVELLTPVVAQALVEAGVEDDAHRRGRPRPSGPGSSARCSSACQRRQGARAGVGRAVRRREPPRGAPLRVAPRGARPRAAGRRAARVRRPHDARRHGGPRPLPAARPDHRRRRRRGVRQGRPLPRPRLPGRPGDRPARDGGRPEGDRVPAGDARRRATTSRSAG